jgi:hypothetical protein
VKETIKDVPAPWMLRTVIAPLCSSTQFRTQKFSFDDPDLLDGGRLDETVKDPLRQQSAITVEQSLPDELVARDPKLAERGLVGVDENEVAWLLIVSLDCRKGEICI